MPRVIVAGSALMDMYVILDRHPRIGETVLSKDFKRVPGGKGLNVAVAASKLGSETGFIGKIGSDDLGREIEAFLGKCNISSMLVKSSTDITGMGIITIADKAQTQIYVVYGANDTFTADQVDKTDFRKGDILVGQFEIPYEVTRHFFEQGKKAGTLNILNMSPIRKADKELAKLADIIVVNEAELKYYSKRRALDDKEGILQMMRSLRIRNDQIVLCTLGGKGAIALEGEKDVEVSGRKVDVVDTTGAGDSFLAGLATCLSKGKDIKSAMTYANAAASICVQRIGTSTAMPTAQEVEEVLSSEN